MKRIGQILRSRFFLAALCIVLEFVQLLTVFILLYKFFLPITILAWVFYIGIMLYLINRDEIPEFKLPWLVILCFLPVIGAFVYMLLSSNSTSQKEYKRYRETEQQLKPYQEQSEEIDQLKELDADAYAQANYYLTQPKCLAIPIQKPPTIPSGKNSIPLCWRNCKPRRSLSLWNTSSCRKARCGIPFMKF